VSARGLVPQQVHIPFGVGLNQKPDPRALPVGSLARCLDAAFTEVGGLQTRYPYASIGTNIFGGGTVSDCRRIVENGNELLLFTKSGLYSWNVARSAWVLKGTHLAVKTAEETKFATTDDQIDCDRAELSGTVFYAWTGGSVGYVAAQDKTTGAVLMAPTALTGSGLRLRLTTLTTKVLLTFYDGVAGTYAYALDPASPATGIAGASTTVSTTGGGWYDIVKIPGADTAAFVNRLNPTTSYRIGTITAGLVVTAATVARACAGAIALSVNPAGTHIQVVRNNTTAITGDYIAISGFADVYTAQAIGTSVGSPDHITCAHRSVADSAQYRCYVYWSDGETMKSNWVDTGGTLGTQADFVLFLNLASRAFDHEGRVYLWTSFTLESTFFGAGSVGGYGPGFSYALQNTYFLYRDDAFLVAKALGARAGDMASSVLPEVQSLGSGVFAWCGVERGIINIGGAGTRRTKYSARAPREILFTFDSNEARRTARLGQTLYITGGEILQYDGSQLTEVGFHIYPHYLGFGSTTGAMIDGTYAYRQTWRWDNAHGEVDRSTTATHGVVATAGGPEGVTIAWTPLYTTHKTNRPIAVETWRTAINPPPDSPFYLVTSKDPTDTIAPNQYLPNDPTLAAGASFSDALVDTDITSNETAAENGGLLEPLAPPPATIICATADRIFLAGVAGDPHRVWYSRQRNEGEVASFHDALTVNVPRAGGDITAIAVRDGVLYVWRETACYALPGDGFDNLGQGQNFGPSRLISSDVGCLSMEALGATSQGFVFKSSKGWYALTGAQVEYIGGPVSDYDSDSVVAVHVLEGQHQIRVLSTARMLVLDTNVNQWAEWTIASALHACLWNGTYHYLNTSGALAEQTTHTATDYGMDIETAWIPLGQIQGYGRIWEINILGECRSAGYLKVRIYRNWNDTTVSHTKNWEISPTTVGGPMQVKHRPSTQEMQAIKIRITAIDMITESEELIESTPSDDIFKLSHLTLGLGLERHLARLPTVQTQ
jgi:hypothetical protein